MQVISRVQFSKTPDMADLYMRFDGVFEDKKIIFLKNSTVSLNTYFNSIYENYYNKYTNIRSFDYLLKLEGDFIIAAYREIESNPRQLIYQGQFEQCQINEYQKITLPTINSSQESGRIYIEITCLSTEGYFLEGLVTTTAQKQQDVTLGIVICTFKKETYVKNTVNRILQDNLLQDKNIKIFVVDNGKTLQDSDFGDERVALIPNRNLGGSGGFTKGLIEGLQADIYTHFLLMDDDIELDSEVIYKLISLYEYAQTDFAIAGSMLDLYKKTLLHEAGALYNQYINTKGELHHRSFEMTSLKHNLDLSDSTSLNLLSVEEPVDYGAFWFFAVSKEVIKKIGLPFPFFIKLDDIEFGLRVNTHLKNGIVPFPGIAVWHEPFYTKKPVWDLYYRTRNQLITNSIYGCLDYLSTIIILTRGIVYNLLIFDYNTAKMYLQGFEDYLQGPSIITKKDSEILHSQICAASKSHQSQTTLTNPLLKIEDYQISKVGKLQKLASLITLNGHLLPQFLIKNESALIRYGFIKQERDSICKGFAKKRIIFILDNNSQSHQHELDKQTGISILLAWFKAILRSRLQWSKVNSQWQKVAKDLTSITFWQSYLEPRTNTES